MSESSATISNNRNMVVENEPARNKEARPIHQSYESDEEPPTIPNPVALWRLPPEHSFSDWTIQISYRDDDGGSNEGTKVDVYRVHKTIMSFGHRHSLYFARLFSSEYVEHATNRSSIELDKLAAKAFPNLLDYIYCPDSELVISTATAAALYHLGGYFEMRRLRWDAKQFWKKDISLTSCDTYFEHARILCDDKIMGALMEFCAKNISQVEESSPLLEVTDVDFWLGVLESMDPEHSEHASKLVTSYVMKNRQVSADEFQKLTADRYLPLIHADTAIQLMDKERELMKQYEKPDELSNLQKKCIETIGENAICLPDSPLSDTSLLQKQNPFVLTSLLDVCHRKLIKLLQDPRTYITVEGAGGADFNGTYKFAGVVNGGHCYKKPCVQEKNEQCQALIRSTIGLEEWFISVSVSGDPRRKDTVVDFYMATPTKHRSGWIPPNTGWSPTVFGKDPAPTLHFQPVA